MMLKTTFIKSILVILCFSIISNSGAFAQEHQDIVTGNLIQFNENGTWCWYQDERAVVDTEKDKMVLASVASASGPGGWRIDGDINATIFDLSAMTPQKYLLKKGGGVAFYCDDHNCPALLVRPDGKYIAMYAAHFNDTCSYYRIYDEDEWGREQRFDWNEEIPGGSNFQTTYSNLFHLSAEGRTYNFARTNNRSPNSMISTDLGDTWTYGGQLSTISNVGYVNGYFKYSSNGVDRIDFVCTEHHPDNYNTSIYHGYIMDAKSYKSDGTLLDSNILDNDFIPEVTDFTTVFEAGTVINDMTMYRCWNIDVHRYEDGNIAAIISARINNNEGGGSITNANHAFIYCRYDGTKWSYTYLGEAGLKLLSNQEDYTGLAALHPNDQNTIYISTHIDPRDNLDLGVHEIFKGVTNDQGATWEWSPITWNSVRDNLRPIIPAWDENHTALLWFRGSFVYAQIIFDAAIVGIIENKEETTGLMTYVDANTTNTLFASGEPLEFTGPSRDMGPADDKWHIRSGFANGNEVFASGEIGGEDAPVIKTELEIIGGGTYDIWVNFWGNPDCDWRIRAGLSEENMQLFRQMACKQVLQSDFNSAIVVTDAGNTFLYQAYLGRVQLSEAQFRNTLNIFIDDETMEAGTSGSMVGNIARTWYDGVSYAKVEKTGVSTGLLVNGDFSDGDNGWQLVVQNPAVATGAVVDGEFKIDITNAGTESWHVQLHQLNLLIENNKTYEVSFDAYAATNKQIYMGVGKNAAPWTMYGGIQSFTITQNPQTYTYSFLHTEPTDNAARMVFDVGLSAIDITFDNIILREITTAIDQDTEETHGAESFKLLQNYPNPFNPSTAISFSLPQRSYVRLVLVNVLGKEVMNIADDNFEAGVHNVQLNASNLASGVYFYRMEAGKFSKVMKMNVIK